MDNSSEMMSLCRLCLVKDQVNVPIFEEQGDVRQIFFKISSCLPVKVSRDDKLPKKICDGCLYKLDMLYEFWKTSANAEKTLLSWLGQAGVKGTDVHQTLSAVAQEITNKPNDSGGGAFVKEEPNDAAAHQTQEVDPNFMLQNFQQKWGEDNAAAGSSASAAAASSATVEEPPRKRARRTAAVKAQINLTPETDEDDDDDMDNVEPITKVEDESDESDGDDRDDGQFGDVSGTNNDDQPGPSGVGKDGGEIPWSKLIDFKTEPTETSLNNYFNLVQVDQIKVLESMTLSHDNSKKPYTCPLCKRNFSTAKSLQKHMRTHGEKKYMCDKCGNKFSSKGSLTTHKRKKHAKKDGDEDFENIVVKKEPHKCHECGKLFRAKSLLKRHESKHENKVKECELCGYKFVNLRIHKQQMHRAQRGVECDVCQKVLVSEKSLLLHLKTVHLSEQAPYICETCGKGFFRKTSLDQHVKYIHSTNSYLCDVCSREFRCLSQFKLHTMTHDSEKRNRKCHVCNEIFPIEKFYKHQRKHKKPEVRKRVICDICGKAIAGNVKLQIHKRTHTGEKPFGCSFCEKKFISKTILKQHMVVHTRERPHTCIYCDKSFTQRTPLVKHMKHFHDWKA